MAQAHSNMTLEFTHTSSHIHTYNKSSYMHTCTITFLHPKVQAHIFANIIAFHDYTYGKLLTYQVFL